MAERTVNTDDWPTTLATFHRLFGDLHTRRPPRGVTDRNFVTSEWLGYVRTPDGGSAEISSGWFLDHRLFGVTFDRLPSGFPDPRDQMCDTLEEALELVRPS
jgi:hypothetical protein